MNGTDFVAKFGGVFEHSPWIAIRALGQSRGENCNTADGLHRVLCEVFQSASEEERLGVLTAHPDLAGRLALAGGLTGDSTREQASAGLDSLSESELQRFTALNDRYTEKFRFPFIMAVKGRSKDEILQAFESRVENDLETEFTTACAQVEQIALLRLKDMLP
ncbi:2-oxo-4-hydroxy-4-carboxy-5-ureidoimidazoline decarboxylase [Pelagibius sp. Alg239-R121]|uniref:2-oxo-4-hydroxy-4-carboxy-5-ureidoimidazoline decarboxylase n=1 Tax=Pelagibius sp. Alg239-R121 TaxID=2993448 RepID=UPI002AC35D54|nr:2-oxo-4-hydroxy-4-carboxy-5-ureidoimidazoline decarboxylase [Pelagibius sp. Alg239-R121]